MLTRAPRAIRRSLQLGEGVIGQCAIDARATLISDVPSNVVRIGLGLFRDQTL